MIRPLEDDAGASKQVGVHTIYKILLIYVGGLISFASSVIFLFTLDISG